MIVGNYYINNFLVLGIILAFSGVAAYFAGFPGMILGEETETDQDFSIQLENGELISGKNSAISLLNSEGNPISQEEVYVNNQRVGQTDQEGRVEFVVPDSSSITVSASASGSEINEVFEVRSDQGDSDEGDGSNDGNGSDDGNVEDNQSISDGNTDQDSDQTDEDDGGTDNGGSDSDNETVSTDPGDETGQQLNAELSAPSNVQINEGFELDASDSTGEILSYSWSLGDGNTETTDTPELDYSFDNSGTYEITLTVNGENDGQDQETVTVEVRAPDEPSISIANPVDGYETDQSSISYDFDVDNAYENSSYSIIVDQKSVESGNLDEGSNSVQKTVEIPESSFETYVQVSGNGETFESERITIDASQISEPEPSFNLLSPAEQETVETLESNTSVEFEYEVVEREWATSATLNLYSGGSKVEERPVSVAPGNNSETLNEVETGSYTYEIVLTDGEREVSKSSEFSIQQVEPEYSVQLLSPEDEASVGEENPDDFQDVSFNVSYETDTDATLYFEIIALENGSNTYVTDSGPEGEQQWTTEYDEGEVVNQQSIQILEGMNYYKAFDNTFDVAIPYEWRSWIVVDGEVRKSTDYNMINVTEEP